MNAYELAEGLLYVSNEMEYNHFVSDWKLLYESALVLKKQADEIKELRERVEFLEEKSVMVDPQEMKGSFVYKYLYGDEMLEAQQKINNLLRKMVDNLDSKK